MVEAPVPMMATRRPVRSCPWSHCAEWKAVPAKVAGPVRSGTEGSESPPPPLMRTSAVNGPRAVSSAQTDGSASQRADSRAASKAIWSSTP